jgi:hypothetical protein
MVDKAGIVGLILAPFGVLAIVLWALWQCLNRSKGDGDGGENKSQGQRFPRLGPGNNASVPSYEMPNRRFSTLSHINEE